MDGMTRLPDGSGFFVATIGPREPGFVNLLKYRPQGCARRWLFVWRMYRTARHLCPDWSVWRSARAAWRCP